MKSGMPIRLMAALCGAVLLLAAGGLQRPATAQGRADGAAPGAVVGIPSDAASKLVDIMTEYTVAIGAGFTGGSLLVSLFTRRTPVIILGGIAGIVAGNITYANYLRSLYNRPLGQN